MMRKHLSRNISFMFLMIFGFGLITPFISKTNAAATIIVTATDEYQPGYYWCQHSDGHWSTSSSEMGLVTAADAGGVPSKTWVTTNTTLKAPSSGWEDAQGNPYPNSKISDTPKPISVKMGKFADPNMAGIPTIVGNQVQISGWSGKGIFGAPEDNVCGSNPNMVYPFPVVVTFQATVTLNEGTAVIKHFTETGTSLSSVFNDRQESLINDQTYSYTHPNNTNYEYVGYKKSTTGSPPSGGLPILGDPPSFKYTGSFQDYYLYYYYKLKNGAGGSFTGDFDIQPSVINYKETFKLHPKNFTFNGCTYKSHQYKIDRGGLSYVSPEYNGMSSDTSFPYGNYPYVIGIGTHTVSLKINTTNCGSSDWMASKTLTVNGPTNNAPPTGKIGFVYPYKPTEPVYTVLEGTVMDLVLIFDSSIPTPVDPDGDTIYFDGFDFTNSSNWAKSIPTKSVEYTDGFHSITMDGLGTHTVKASIRDEFGATTTLTTYITVVPPNPVPVISGPTSVVEGRPLSTPFSAAGSYSPIAGRTIDHTKDEWTNNKTVYTVPGTEVITLSVTDSIGLKSLQPASHTLTVKPDLPPIPELDFVPITVRSSQVTFTNKSYSPDNDTIVSNVVSYRYDANNDGIYAEASTPVTMDANKQFKLTPTKVGKYQFTVTVVEDWGKQATKNFILDVVNDSPTASFTLESTVTEPVVAPFTNVTPSQLMSGEWGNTSLNTPDLPKRWAIDATENSIVAVTDEEKFSAISSNVLTQVNYSGFGNFVCSGNCSPNTNYGSHDYYLGNGYITGYNMYYDQFHVYNQSPSNQYSPNLSVNKMDNLHITAVDRQTGLAYGYYQRLKYEPSTYEWVTIRIADLITPQPTIPFLQRTPVPTTGSYYYNPNIPMHLRPYIDTPYYYANFALDTKEIDPTTASLKSYPWGSLTPSSTTQFTPYVGKTPTFSMYWKDMLGNVYAQWVSNTGTSPPAYDLVKLNNVTGQIDWKISYSPRNTPTRSVFGDGRYVIQHEVLSTSQIHIRDVNTGTIIKSFTISSSAQVVGIYDGIILVLNNGVISAYDYDFNLLWSKSGVSPRLLASYPFASYGVISKDGYYTFIDREYKQVPGYSYYRYERSLKMINVRTGDIQSIDLQLYSSDSYDNYDFYDLEYVGDGEVYFKYTMKPTTQNPTPPYSYSYYARYIKTQPTTDPIVANEVMASGQFKSPTALNTANGEFAFELKFNQPPNANKPAGFGFRIQDNNNLYRVEIFKDSVQLVKYVNGVRSAIKTVSYPSTTTTYMSYKVRAVGTNIKVYASGTPIIDIHDSQFSAAGGFGLYAASEKAEFKGFGYKLMGGGTAITLDNVALVDEAATYVTTYADVENDPKIDPLTEWTFKHTEPNKFLDTGDGKSGLSSLHNQTVQSPYLSFDRVGLYQVSYKVKDDPNAAYSYPNMTFDDYRKESDPYSTYIVVHRKPVAVYSLSIDAENKVKWTDTSYDPDRWLSASNYSTEDTGINYQTTRGILERKYYFVAPSGTTKSEKLVTPTEAGVYLVGMAVKDEYGAWSAWNEQSITISVPVTPNTPPVAGFTTSYTNTFRNVDITINSTASDAEDGDRTNLKHEYYIRNVTTGGSEGLFSTSRTSWTKAFSTLGTFNIRQVVEDSQGITAQYERQITISNRLPVANVTLPSSTDQNYPTRLDLLRPTFTWSYGDVDSDAQVQYQFKVYRYGGILEYDSGIKTGAMTSAAPTTDLPEFVNMYVQVRVFDGYDWSTWSAVKYFYIETNRPPVAAFVWNPNPAWEADTISLVNQSTDPDPGDVLTYDWTIVNPSGGSSTSKLQQPSISNALPGVYKVTLKVTDSKGATDTITKNIPVGQNLLTADIGHIQKWIDFINDNGLDLAKFLAGEPFDVSATTSSNAAQVQIRFNFPNAFKAVPTQFLYNPNDSQYPSFAYTFTLASSNNTSWTSTSWRKYWIQVPDGTYTATVTCTYQNGSQKTQNLTIVIKDHIWEGKKEGESNIG